MRITPKKTKYHYTFRNKLRTKKITNADIRALFPLGKRWAEYNQIFKINAWCDRLTETHDASARTGPFDPFALATFARSATFAPLAFAARAKGSSKAREAREAREVRVKSIETFGSSSQFLSHAMTERLLFGNYGIIFEAHGTLSAKFIKTIHLDIAKTLKKKSKVWLRLCCDTPVTARPVETRMGKGKGAISYWETKVCPGQVFFEFSGITKTGALSILKKIQEKSPLRLRLMCAY